MPTSFPYLGGPDVKKDRAPVIDVPEMSKQNCLVLSLRWACKYISFWKAAKMASTTFNK